VDDDDDGTFETTLTITTDYVLAPYNAADESPVRPFTEVHYVGDTGTGFPESLTRRPTVQVTAQFGWPAVPVDVKRACLIQSVMLFKASDAAFGVLQLGVDGFASRISARLHPVAEALLESYAKPRVA